MKKWHPLYSYRVQYVNELIQKPYKWIHFYFFAKLIQIFVFIQKIALKNFWDKNA